MMKPIILCFFAFLLLSVTTTEKIVGTWEVYKISGSKDVKKNMPRIQFVFEANGKCLFKDLSEKGRTKTGKYVCDDATKTLYIEERPGKDAEPMRIVKLTDEKLILAPEKGASHGLQRLYLKKVG